LTSPNNALGDAHAESGGGSDKKLTAAADFPSMLMVIDHSVQSIFLSAVKGHSHSR